MKVANVKFVNSGLFFVKEDRNYANTDGSVITQTVIRSWPPFTATAVAPDISRFPESRATSCSRRGAAGSTSSSAISSATRGSGARRRSQKLKAKPVDVGRYDLVLHPSHLWLTIHESIGHPTELDRAMGYEANYAGTSFVAPPEKVLGKLKYGPEFMNIQGDRTQEGALRDDRLGRRRREAGRRSSSSRTESSTTTRRRASRRRGSSGGTRSRARRRARTAARTPTTGRACSSSACRTSRCCPATKEQSCEDLIAATDKRHRDHRRRLVLDRPAALQRAVRRPGLLRDQGRQDRRHAEGRRVPDAHAGLLELDGHDRRQEELHAGRQLLRRQGTAGADRTR